MLRNKKSWKQRNADKRKRTCRTQKKHRKWLNRTKEQDIEASIAKMMIMELVRILHDMCTGVKMKKMISIHTREMLEK